jgi:hypothetical protein
MAHYAFIDDDNKVIEVIAGTDENILIDGLDTETWYSNYRGVKCLRTSYNGKIRKNYAGVGYTYDPDRDAFISPKPDTATGFDEQTCQWIVPIDDSNQL